MNYFHLHYPSVDFFVGQLQTRLRQSSSDKLRDRFGRWNPEIEEDLAIAVVSKIEILNRVVDRLNHGLTDLQRHLETVPEDIARCIDERRALTIPDTLVWNLSVDTDAFLFEAR